MVVTVDGVVVFSGLILEAITGGSIQLTLGVGSMETVFREALALAQAITACASGVRLRQPPLEASSAARQHRPVAWHGRRFRRDTLPFRGEPSALQRGLTLAHGVRRGRDGSFAASGAAHAAGRARGGARNRVAGDTAAGRLGRSVAVAWCRVAAQATRRTGAVSYRIFPAVGLAMPPRTC
jgi:hypothetical protein